MEKALLSCDARGIVGRHGRDHQVAVGLAVGGQEDVVPSEGPSVHQRCRGSRIPVARGFVEGEEAEHIEIAVGEARGAVGAALGNRAHLGRLRRIGHIEGDHLGADLLDVGLVPCGGRQHEQATAVQIELHDGAPRGHLDGAHRFQRAPVGAHDGDAAAVIGQHIEARAVGLHHIGLVDPRGAQVRGREIAARSRGGSR